MFPNTLTESLSESIIKQASYLSADERLDLLMLYAKKAKSVWMLCGENGFVMLEQEDILSLPLWPHRDFANQWMESQEMTAEPKEVELDEFINTWLPGLQANSTYLTVFPLEVDNENLVLSGDELNQVWRESEES